ncbi:MAG: hypothetical protein AAF728_02255 [Cyanobacteria bacterium P01_D01_bin.128]
MHDNKIRLSRDVLEKAELIAAEWGLKNARAAVEAVFRRYCEDYGSGRDSLFPTVTQAMTQAVTQAPMSKPVAVSRKPSCEALDALDQLLAL